MTARTSTGADPRGPFLLGPNQPRRPYRGGAGIAALRGVPVADGHRPEDFLASTTTVHGSTDVGLSRLPDGRVLRDAVQQDPTWFLGAEHVARHGASTRLLVKLLSTGQRLFVHLHPDDRFAAEQLTEPNGKTEAWVVLDAPPGGGTAYLGFGQDVTAADVVRWVDGGETGDLLGLLNPVPVRAGDALLVPAGLVHALDPGVTMVELQQPSDLSVLLEWRGFDGLTRESATLGLSAEQVFAAMRSTRTSAADLADLAGVRGGSEGGGDAVVPLLPAGAQPFFRAERVEARHGATLSASFAVLVVTDGEGTAAWDGGELPVRRGDVVLLPHGLGPVALEGGVGAVRCLPPAPDVVG